MEAVLMTCQSWVSPDTAGDGPDAEQQDDRRRDPIRPAARTAGPQPPEYLPQPPQRHGSTQRETRHQCRALERIGRSRGRRRSAVE
jgi:hypothetical protein